MASLMTNAATTQVDLPQGQGLTLGDLTKTISRQKGIFWSTLILSILIGGILSVVLPPQFAAAAEVLVTGPSNNGLTSGPGQVLSEIAPPNTGFTMATSLEILQSQQLYFTALQTAGIAIPRTEQELEQLPRITIRQKRDSQVFVVIAEGGNRDQVQELAASYPRILQDYLDNQVRDTISRGVEFVQGRKNEEETALKAAETELARFKSTNGIVDARAELERRLSSVNAIQQQLIDARAAAARSEASLSELERLLAQTTKVRNRVLTGQNNEQLFRNRERLSELRIQREALATRYTDEAEAMKEINAQIKRQEELIAEIDKQLNQSFTESNPEYDVMLRRVAEARSERDGAVQRRNELEGLYAEGDRRVKELVNYDTTVRELDRRIALHQTSLQDLTQLSERFSLRDQQITASATSLTQSPLARQTRPNTLLNLVIATLLGFTLAAILALARDAVQDKVNTVEEAYVLSRKDILARIPERAGAKSPLITDPQTSLAFESYRVLRSVIGFSAATEPIKSLLVTSTLPKEGKTVVASNLAVAYALNGQRVCLVDASFRNPAVHRIFNKNDKPGLGDVLLGSATVDSVLSDTPVPGLQTVNVGTTPANATEALGSARMKSILDELENRFDMVIIDTTACLALADTPSLAPLCDASIMVVHLGKPSKTEFSEAVGLLRAASPRMLGVVHNRLRARMTRLTKV